MNKYKNTIQLKYNICEFKNLVKIQEGCQQNVSYS